MLGIIGGTSLANSEFLKKWQNYRISLLSDNALANRINDAHQFLLDNDIYSAEELAWEYTYSESDLDYMFDWLEDRLEFLDEYFDQIEAVVICDY